MPNVFDEGRDRKELVDLRGRRAGKGRERVVIDGKVEGQLGITFQYQPGEVFLRGPKAIDVRKAGQREVDCFRADRALTVAGVCECFKSRKVLLLTLLSAPSGSV